MGMEFIEKVKDELVVVEMISVFMEEGNVMWEFYWKFNVGENFFCVGVGVVKVY